jgi:hypothetical protein
MAPGPFKVLRRVPITPWMEISFDPLAVAATKVATDRTVAVLKKQKDVQEAQAQALIQLVQQSVPEGTGRIIDVRA